MRELNEFLPSQVAPCSYIDSTALARPGEWPTFDGQHHTVPGYTAWATALTRQIVVNATVRQVQAQLPRR